MKALILRRLLRRAASALAVVTASAAALILAPGALQAQATGVIRGTVTAEGSNTPIEGVQVSLVGNLRFARTDAAGVYRLAGMPVGVAVVRVLRIGYVGQTRSVTIASGGTLTADFVLKIALVDAVRCQDGAESRKKKSATRWRRST